MRCATSSLLSWFLGVGVWLSLPTCVQAQTVAPSWNWAHQSQGTSTAWPYDMAVDAAGNTYVVGTLYGTMTLDNGVQLAPSTTNDADGFVVKYTPTGTVAWAHRLGSAPTYDTAYGVALDATGNVYVTGQFTGQITVDNFQLSTIPSASGAYLVKYDAQGVAQWARQSTESRSGETAIGQDVELDAAGNIYLSGTMTWGGTTFDNSTLAPAPGASYAHFVVKYDATGIVQWAQADGSTTSNSSNSAYLAVAPEGEVYLSCSIQQTAIFGGQPYPSRGSTDAFVVKYTALGTRQWVQQIGGPGDDEVRRGTVDATGSLYLPVSFSDQATVGSTTLHSVGNKDQALLKMTNLGVLDWVRTAGGADYDVAQSAALDPFGNVYLVGMFFGTATAGPGSRFTSAGHYDALMLSYTPAGLLRWGTATGGLDPDDFTQVGFDGAGIGRVIGRYSTTLPLGASTLTGPVNQSKWFVAQFADPMPTVSTIATVAPSSGMPGQTITLNGSGFVGVTAVLFNNLPAAAFAVQSPRQLTAIVPAGNTAGLVSVRTAAGTVNSPQVFNSAVLSLAATQVRSLALSPNPAKGQLLLLGLSTGSSVQLVDMLGRLARETTLSGEGEISVLGLVPGCYMLRATDKNGLQYTARVMVQ
jgi:hypothetical protein